MNKSDIKILDTINGPGVRVSLFVSGCNIHCKNCFNKKCQDFNYGTKFTYEDITNITDTINKYDSYYSGLSILGGEPFDNAISQLSDKEINGLCEFINLYKKGIKNPKNKNIWIWSGYTFEEICKDPIKFELLKLVDVLVDGPFIDSQKNLNLKFRGSENQRIIDVKKSLIEKNVIILNNF